MDLKLVKQLLELISESEANEISIEQGNFKLKVKKQSDSPAVQHMQYQVPPLSHAGSNPAQTSADTPKTSPSESASKTEGDIIKSPIVGTFYEAASPDSDPFVKVGDHVEKGQAICIIEAMKIMNEIEAEHSGVIQKILVSNASPVEYDQPLFIIKKD